MEILKKIIAVVVLLFVITTTVLFINREKYNISANEIIFVSELYISNYNYVDSDQVNLTAVTKSDEEDSIYEIKSNNKKI